MNQETVSIHTEYIQLDQLLKYANVLSTGGQVKVLLEENKITLNDVVTIANEIRITVVKEA